MNIYVGNLSYDVGESDLEQLFAEFGSVTSAKVITDRDSGRSKGFGFVEIDDAGAAEQAIEALNGKEIGGRRIVVNQARERAPRQNRDRDRGGRRY